MHFLKEIVENPELEDPFNKHLNVHRHFARYSKGVFIGPAFKITKTNTKITIKGSFEFEDFIQEMVVKTVPDETLKIKCSLIASKDISDTITNLGLEWRLKKTQDKDTGVIRSFKATFDGEINKNILLESIKSLRETSYLLLNFNLNPTCKITTKLRLPQPSKKKPEEDDIGKRLQFCTGIINNTEASIKMIIEGCLSDFKSEIPSKWRTIILTNTYNINDIEIPKNVKNSKLLRVMATRKGKLIRTINVDKEIIENQYNIVV
jgi:hypothetical protein